MVEQDNLQKKEREFIKIMMIIALSVLLGVGCTFGYFFEFSPSRDLKTWVDTATIFTGVATPILTMISVFLLYFVWKDNRRELAETKKALIEQSDTQNFSVIKNAVFEVVEQVQLLSQRKVVLINYGKEIKLFDFDDESLTIENEDVDDDMKYKSTTYIIEDLLQEFFLWAKSERVSNDPRSSSQQNLIFKGQFYDYIEKIKTLALFMQALKSTEYRQILEITLFAKLTLFTWLFFAEIAYHLLKCADSREKKDAELVFAEIAGLTCRQIKEVYWIDSLSDEVLLELKERKLL